MKISIIFILIICMISFVNAIQVGDIGTKGANFNTLLNSICINCTYNYTTFGLMDYTNIALTNQSNDFNGDLTANSLSIPTNTISYSNTGGTGDRSSLIDVTTSITFHPGFKNLSKWVDGVIASTFLYWDIQPVNSSKYLRFDFRSPKQITESKFYQQTVATHGVWQWQGSNDNFVSDINNIGPSFTLGASTAQVIPTLSTNSNSYRYYQLLGVSGATQDGPYLYEFEFKISSSTPNVNSTINQSGISGFNFNPNSIIYVSSNGFLTSNSNLIFDGLNFNLTGNEFLKSNGLTLFYTEPTSQRIAMGNIPNVALVPSNGYLDSQINIYGARVQFAETNGNSDFYITGSTGVYQDTVFQSVRGYSSAFILNSPSGVDNQRFVARGQGIPLSGDYVGIWNDYPRYPLDVNTKNLSTGISAYFNGTVKTEAINALNYSVNNVQGITKNITIVKSVDLVGLTKVMCDMNFSGGILISSNC